MSPHTVKHFPPMKGDKQLGNDGAAHHPTKWSAHQFTCFDGEGMQVNGMHQYVHLAAYDGTTHTSITNTKGLTSAQCFDFLTQTAAAHPLNINVIFGGSYDFNKMLRNVPPPLLIDLLKLHHTKWKHWVIRMVQRKTFNIHDIRTNKTCMLWDVFGFFQSTFEAAMANWLDIVDPIITAGKAGRRTFTLSELPEVQRYCAAELEYFEAIMQRLWQAFENVNIRLSRWDGAGAAAQALLQQHGMKRHKGTEEQQDKHYTQARCAYAGGRFELMHPGDYRQPVYHYDINSAYPAAMVQLPPFTGLTPCRKKSCEYGPYDLLKIHYEGDLDYAAEPFHPYFFRSKLFSIYYPQECTGWHWGVEWLKSGKKGDVLQHLHWDDTGDRPFEWVQGLYDYRKSLGPKKEGMTVKLSINSIYGKLAQQKGWTAETNRKPAFHQLYWAGWITAYTRATMYEAMMQSPQSMIAVETDGLFCTDKLDLPISEKLGDWSTNTLQSITYVQSGLYFYTTEDGREEHHYRGLDKDQLTRDMVLDAWTAGKKSIEARSTRFRTLGTSLQGTRLTKWGEWVEEEKEVVLRVPPGKRFADPFDNGVWGYNIHKLTAPAGSDFYKQESTPCNVMWCGDLEDKLDFWQAMEEEEERYILEA